MHCWRTKYELISNVLLWTPSHGRAKAGRPARTYIQQLCVDMGCNLEDLPEAINDREVWRERDGDMHASSTTRWWDESMIKKQLYGIKYSYQIIIVLKCSVCRGCRIHWLHLCNGVRLHPTGFLDIILNNLMVRLQYWSFISFIASGRSSGLHPISSHSCCMYVRAGRPAFSRPYVGVHRSISFMSSSLFL